MRMFNWAEAFKEQQSCEDILKKVRKTEIYYWIFIGVSLIIVIAGMTTIEKAAENNLKELIWGLFLAITGIVNIAVIKIWAQIRLTMYFNIWERNHWIQGEIRKSEAADIC